MTDSVTLPLAIRDQFGYTNRMGKVHPLKAYRLKQEPPLSQKGLAKLISENRWTVIRWETGARKIRPDALPKIAEVTGIAPAELRPDLAAALKRPQRGGAQS